MARLYRDLKARLVSLAVRRDKGEGREYKRHEEDKDENQEYGGMDGIERVEVA